MFQLLSRMSITRQFTLFACLAVVLTGSALGITFKQGHDLAIADKREQVRHLVEAAVSLTRFFVQQEQNGTMTKSEAQKMAMSAVAAIRYDTNNYFYIYRDDYTMLSHPNKAMIGQNRATSTDTHGNLMVKPQVDSAISGHPQFHEFYFPRETGGTPLPKQAYAIAVPEWKWVIGSGLYTDDVNATLAANLTNVAIFLLPLFGGFAALVVIMRRSIAQLLASLAKSMQRLARGENQTEIPGLTRSDEIGEMAAAVQVFKDNGIKLQATEAETARQREAAEAERRHAEAARMALQREQQEVMNAVASGLDHLAQGDLTSRLRQAFPADYEKLREDFNATAHSLRDAMKTITSATTGINSSSDQIASASDNLSRRTEQQAANLEETAAALNHLVETVNKTASGAGQAAKAAAEARASAEQSGEIVRQAVDAMDRIKDSAVKIANIISVIDEIAFQTNLLALNAGVEAARAGDAGRGFAVVASEVRALAQRSAEAAKEIKGLIQASTVQVETGVALVGQTGSALKEIIGRVATMDGLVHDISASSQEQASGLAEINTAIGQMDQAVQQNAAMVEESTAAAHALKSETEDLTAMVRRFNIAA